MKTVTIFDNMDMEGYLEEEREYLGNAYTENDVWEMALSAANEDWHNFMNELANLCPYGVLCQGIFKGWQGAGKGGFIADDIGNAMEMILKDCDYWKVEEVGRGHLVVEGHHHDGYNRVELFALTREAMEHYEDWEQNNYQPWDCYNEEQLHDMMIRNRHARIMNYTKKVW